MYCGPFGAEGFVNGFVASQARNATSYWGRKRLSARRSSRLFPARYAANQALKFAASCARSVNDCWKARFASVRVVDACASWSLDSVPHFAAEYPDQAAVSVTIESSTASTIEIRRS